MDLNTVNPQTPTTPPKTNANNKSDKVTPETFSVIGYHLYDYLKLKTLVPILSGKLVGSSPQELQLQYGKRSYLFVYRYGSLVFVNMDPQKLERELNRVTETIEARRTIATTESYDIRMGSQTRVEFEHVEVKRFTKDTTRMIATTVGQSAALEHFETLTERMLEDSAKLVSEVGRLGRVPWGNKRLVRMIGSTAGTRQEIISTLAVMDAPDETWESKSLEALFRDLQDNFEIELRSKILDKKLLLIQDNIELLVNLTSTKRGLLLETLIVLLIVFEIVLAFLGFW